MKSKPTPDRPKRRAARVQPADDSPRYLHVARTLMAAIGEGRYPVGSQLPTEHELCERHHISRFTAREAVRVLQKAGMVTRRPRAGTIVMSTSADTRYTHTASSLQELGQYARDTVLEFREIRTITLDRTRARELGVTPARSWTAALAVRRDTSKGRPICVTRVYLSPALPGIGKRLKNLRRAVYTVIAEDYGMPIERVVQELQGAVLNEADAALLESRAGEPALRIVRRYYDGSGKLLEVADSVHPSDRYSYRMELRK